MLMREISQKDLSRTIIGASDASRGRFLTNMARRVRSFIVEESKTLALDLPAHEPTVSRQRILEWADTLRDNGQIHWLPNEDAQAFDGDVDLVPPTPQDDPVEEISCEELEVGEIAEIYAELTELARRGHRFAAGGRQAVDHLPQDAGPLSRPRGPAKPESIARGNHGAASHRPCGFACRGGRLES